MADIKIGLSEKQEYNLTVENAVVRLLINSHKNTFDTGAAALTSHTHSYTEFFVCTAGEIAIDTENGTVNLGENDAAIIPAGVNHHKVGAEDGSVWESVGFSVVKRSVKQNFDLYKVLKPLCAVKEPRVYRNIPEICKKVCEFHTMGSNNTKNLAVLWLVPILACLSENEGEKKAPDTAASTHMPDIFRIAWLEDLIETRYSEPLTSKTVAELLHISPRHLSRVVKKRYGKTLHEVIVEKRIDIAAKLLLTTSLSANMVSQKVGFSTSTVFYNEFRKRFDVTPAEYRNLN